MFHFALVPSSFLSENKYKKLYAINSLSFFSLYLVCTETGDDDVGKTKSSLCDNTTGMWAAHIDSSSGPIDTKILAELYT